MFLPFRVFDWPHKCKFFSSSGFLSNCAARSFSLVEKRILSLPFIMKVVFLEGGGEEDSAFFFNGRGRNAVINAVLVPINYFMLHNPGNSVFACVVFKQKACMQRSIGKTVPQIWFCMHGGEASRADCRL